MVQISLFCKMNKKVLIMQGDYKGGLARSEIAEDDEEKKGSPIK